MIGGSIVTRFSSLTYPQKPQGHLFGSSASAIATVTGGSLCVRKERFSLLTPINSPLLYTEVGVAGQTSSCDGRGDVLLSIATFILLLLAGCFAHDMLSGRGKPGSRNTFSGYSKHFWSVVIPKDRYNEVVWGHRWHNPQDLRSETPVHLNKLTTQSLDRLALSDHWEQKPPCPPLQSFNRSNEERAVYSAMPSSRCEEWSTLRSMMPSRGHCMRHMPPRWGTSESTAPSWSTSPPKRYPHINSPMTK